MRVNWNWKATVQLSVHGKNVYESYYREEFGIDRTAPKTIRTELWEIAQIFGRAMYNGGTPVFETMSFEVEEDQIGTRR